MSLYMLKSQFISITKKSDHQGRDYKGGLLYCQRKDIVKQVHKMCIARSVSKMCKARLMHKTKETSK